MIQIMFVICDVAYVSGVDVVVMVAAIVVLMNCFYLRHARHHANKFFWVICWSPV